MAVGSQWTPLVIVSWGIFGLAILLYYLFYLASACRHRIVLWSRACCRHHHQTRAIQSKYEKQLSLSIMLSTGGAWISKMMRMKNSETHSAQGIRNTLLSCTVLAGFAFSSALTSLQRINSESAAENGLFPQQAADLAVAGFLFLSFLHFLVVLRSGAHLTFLLGAITGQDELSAPATAAAVAPSAAAPALPPLPPAPADVGATKKKDDEGVATIFPAASSTGSTTTATAGVSTGVVPTASADNKNEPLLAGGGGSAKPAAAAGDIELGRLSAIPVPVAPASAPSSASLALSERVGKKLTASEAVEIGVICERMIRQLSIHFSLAFRSFFWSLPAAVFSAGPIPFIVATALVWFFLLYLDTGGFGL